MRRRANLNRTWQAVRDSHPATLHSEVHCFALPNDGNMQPEPRLGKTGRGLHHGRFPASTSAAQMSLCRSPTVK